MSYVIAHGDLDGLASAAVVMAAFRQKGENISLEIAQPYTLARSVIKLVSLKPRKLIVIDLGIDDPTWPAVSRSLREVIAQGGKIMWIDHHPSTLKHSYELLELGISLLYSSCGSASTIVREAFVELTETPFFYYKLTKLGEIADGVAEGDTELNMLAEMLTSALSAPSSKEEFKKKLVKMWIEEKKLVSDEVALLAEEFDKVLADKLRNIKEKVILDVKKGIIIDARSLKLSGLAGHIAARIARDTNKATIVFFAPSDQVVVATCRVPHNVDFDALAELTPVAITLGGGGGGHSKAAALRVPAAFGDVFINKICEIIKRKLD